ncbi:MAG: pantetheine-phosphate adenylyltransferase [Thaumarchaeota archaeon]|nr:pantetheine-phosphate adenylyltransferase [Nitrososphaerota archaeon]MDE1867356.1 pantetheine-phosphate adenylyltransferase [Nitrososphaerota archaeon]
MKKYNLVALGGTFDLLHRGHLELLSKGFSVSSKVIIGLTSDELARKKGKNLIHDYEKRYNALEDTIKRNFPNVAYQISRLENDFGPAVLEKQVEALVVSEETAFKGNELNRLRRQRNSPDVEVIVVPMTLAKDGKRISTSRIKNSEIDSNGNILGVDK